jgi:hypothetical protein
LVHHTGALIAARVAIAETCTFVVRADDILGQLPLPSQLGATRTGGIELNRPRIRAALSAALALTASLLPHRRHFVDH